MPIQTPWQNLAKACLVPWLAVVILFSAYHVYPNREVYYHRLFDQDSKTAFVETALNTCIDDPWDYQPIIDLCTSTSWRKGLTFICGSPRGGVGNVRNVVLNCIRFAIEGGGDLVLPRFMKRDDENLVNLSNGDRFTGDLRDFSYFFDLDHTIESMRLACPQMTVFESTEHFKQMTGDSSFPDIQYVEPQQFAGGFVDGAIMADPENWREAFETWLNITVPYTPEWTAWIDISTPLLAFPQKYQPDVSKSLGRVLRFPGQTRRLAATVYYELSHRFNFNIDPAATGIASNTYFGAHLRTAVDAAVAGFTAYDTQVSFYLDQARSANLSVIYASSDNPSDVARFAIQAWENDRINVTSKNDLLKNEDIEALEALSWDQQALVDYDVLLKASQFGGIYDSTFTANIAVRRHVLSRVEDCYQGAQAMGDEFSRVIGPPGGHRNFFEAMWA